MYNTTYTMATYPCLNFSGSTVSDHNGMHHIESPTLPSGMDSCDFLCWIDTYTSKDKAPLYDDWDSKTHIGTKDLYAADSSSYTLLASSIPAVTVDQLSGSSTYVRAYSSCIFYCYGCEPVCMYSSKSIGTSNPSIAMFEAPSDCRSIVDFTVRDNYQAYQLYYVSEWSSSYVHEGAGGGFPFALIGVRKLSGYTTGGFGVYYNDLALALTNPR